MTESLPRCAWGTTDPLYLAYHDLEWGVPIHDDRRAFDGWDAERIASYGPQDEARLLASPGIVRNRAKVAAVIGNARAYLAIDDFEGYLWSFVGGRPIVNRWTSLSQIPAETDASRALSRDLKLRGFSFVGATIVYAFMQSAGLVNDHLVSCFRHPQLLAV